MADLEGGDLCHSLRSRSRSLDDSPTSLKLPPPPANVPPAAAAAVVLELKKSFVVVEEESADAPAAAAVAAAVRAGKDTEEVETSASTWRSSHPIPAVMEVVEEEEERESSRPEIAAPAAANR